ncbi:Ig-like domain-containing protein [Thermodesulfobacteriota bacterium]
MKKKLVTACLVGVCLCIAFAVGARDAKAADIDFPPYVVKTEPADRTKNVSYRLKEIKVTFDRPMATKEIYFLIHPQLGKYPGYEGSAAPRWERGGTICVLPVKLSPDTVYAVGVNSGPRPGGFQDKKGKVAAPYVWVFKTRK